MFNFLRPFIFNLDPEKAHDLAIKSLKYNFIPQKIFHSASNNILYREKYFISLRKYFIPPKKSVPCLGKSKKTK